MTAQLETDQRPQRFAWAPGNYIAKCSCCGKRFIGDKRAVLCAPCAYNDTEIAKLRDGIAQLRSALRVAKVFLDGDHGERTGDVCKLVDAALTATDPATTG